MFRHPLASISPCYKLIVTAGFSPQLVAYHVPQVSLGGEVELAADVSQETAFSVVKYLPAGVTLKLNLGLPQGIAFLMASLMLPGRILMLHPHNTLAYNCAVVAGFHAYGLIQIHPMTPLSTAQAMLQHLSPGVVVELAQFTSKALAIAIASSLRPQTALSFRPGFDNDVLVQAVSSLAVDTALFVHPSFSVHLLQSIASVLPETSTLMVSSLIEPVIAQSIKRLKPINQSLSFFNSRTTSSFLSVDAYQDPSHSGVFLF